MSPCKAFVVVDTSDYYVTEPIGYRFLLEDAETLRHSLLEAFIHNKYLTFSDTLKTFDSEAYNFEIEEIEIF